MRTDREGRDVTNLPGLWDDSDYEHTPGPWSFGYVCNDWSDGDVVVCAHGMGVVCQITNQLEGLLQYPGVGRTIENQEANARLISAAPELLEAVVQFVSFHEMETETMTGIEVQRLYDGVIDLARLALRKVLN